ncbi:MAG TPA: response regulator transcription factor [Usitatibacter sp.]|nr:response regulator transcription factor [Usitatibacter sp.]
MSAAERIRVEILHADPIARAGLVVACGRYKELEVRESAYPAECQALSRRFLDRSWDVVVADYAVGLAIAAMAGRSGLAWPRAVIVTAPHREWEIRSALQAGVLGYVLSGCGVEDVAAAIRAAYRGVRYLSPQAAARLAESVSREALTAREHDVLSLMTQGLSNKAIANRLEISAGTVKSHLKAIFAKLEVRSRAQAMLTAEERGLLGTAHHPAPMDAMLARAPV